MAENDALKCYSEFNPLSHCHRKKKLFFFERSQIIFKLNLININKTFIKNIEK